MMSLSNWVPHFSTFRRPAPIGFDLASEKLHMVQMQHGRRGLAILAAVSASYPTEQEALLADPLGFKSFIKQALRAQPFRGRRVLVTLPPSELKIMPISYQHTAGQEEQDAVLKELRMRLREELDESVVDYMSIRNDDSESETREVLVAVAKRDRVMAYLDVLKSAGLETIAVDIGPAALCRLVSASSQQGYPNVLLINFGYRKSYLTVVWGKRLMLDREIEFGEAQLVTRLRNNLAMAEPLASKLLCQYGFKVSADDGYKSAGADREIAQTITEVLRPELVSLTNEVHKTLVYAASKTRGVSVDHIYLLGSVARFQNIARWMQDSLAMPVEVLNPFAAFTARRLTGVADATESALATGLALRGVGSVRN